jgi:ABC-type phosphate/phosphonate transport system substrate-binding protein
VNGVSELIVGAVSYHPRVVSIWERFREYFREQGTPIDYVLFSNYERLVEAVAESDVDIGWNTNTAYVALDHRVAGRTVILGMRDIDAQFATVLVARRGELAGPVGDLRGRRLALGSRDSGHAAILPLHFLRGEGLDPSAECELVRFDTDLGKHGDTGDSELRVVRAVAGGAADAGAIGDATWSAFRSQGLPAADGLEIAWRSPTYYHCNFTALDALDGRRREEWRRALLAMSCDDPSLRPAMELEGVRRWLPGDRDGYGSLAEAMWHEGLLGG